MSVLEGTQSNSQQPVSGNYGNRQHASSPLGKAENEDYTMRNGLIPKGEWDRVIEQILGKPQENSL